MNDLAVRVIVGLIHGWTHAYTWRLPDGLASERRLEIESDVWELRHDPEGGRGLGSAIQPLGRLVLGVPDDLRWRVEHAQGDPGRRRLAATALAACLMVATVWWGQAWLSARGSPVDRPVADCVKASASPESTSDLRMQVMRCAGVFFQRRSPSPVSRSQ